MAHIVASITVFVKTHRHYIRREGTPLQTQGLPRCLVPLPREWRLYQAAFFWHLHVLPPIRDLLYLIRNKVRLLIEQIQATVFSNQICS